MELELHPDVEKVLRCPGCGGGLDRCPDESYSCSRCGLFYSRNSAGSFDFRLQQTKTVDLTIQVPCEDSPADFPCSDDLPPNPTPSIDFGNTPVPHHLSRALLSYFPKASRKDSLMLDLGCGAAIHRQVCEHAGFRYVGVDYEAPQAPYLADAHALPFQDSSFEFLLSIAVLEHIQFPFLAISEAQRVLKPGGLFIGTVAFLEPFHGNSYYHHSRLGTVNTLRYGGFEVLQIAASTRWTVFTAQAEMAHRVLFPRIPRVLARGLILAPQIVSMLWWKLARVVTQRARRHRQADLISGAFGFIAKKPHVPGE